MPTSVSLSPRFGTCADNLNTIGQCADLRICVEEGTTSIVRVRELFPQRFVIGTNSRLETFQGLTTGTCNVVASDGTDVLPPSVTAVGYNGPYEVGLNRFSKEPLTPVTRQDDPEWSDFVFWVVSSTFYAEEQGITQATANQMPTMSLFGSRFFQAYVSAIAAVGNYGEIYQRNLSRLLPRSGANLLNLSPNGPQHYARPGI